MLTQSTIKQMSRVCVSVFLPCLVASKLAKGLTWAKFMTAWPMPLFCWAQIGPACLIGLFVRRLVNPPEHLWRPFLCAITFQNSSALPLVIVQSLSEHPPFNQVRSVPPGLGLDRSDPFVFRERGPESARATERARARGCQRSAGRLVRRQDGRCWGVVGVVRGSASSAPEKCG